MKRKAMLECMDAMEDAMLRVRDSRDVWQNDIIYWLCRSVWLLLERAVKGGEKRTAPSAGAPGRFTKVKLCLHI